LPPSPKIPAFALFLLDTPQGAFGFFQPIEGGDAQGSGAADAVPFAHQTPAAEEGRCESRRVDAGVASGDRGLEQIREVAE
jgi:hypothetical protein